ncbi:hypothetical protein niasHS_004030 [Heterodera schachtii]|uniref:IPT/TIG domain-containing protein n=1 Tax=Heterodera schachtii TaxID=97005 RepID=A0ABD2JUK0_HETSC
MSSSSSSTNCSVRSSPFKLNPYNNNDNDNNNNSFQQHEYASGWMDTLWAPPQQPTLEMHSMCHNTSNNNNNNGTAFADYYGNRDSHSYGSSYRNQPQQQQQQHELTVLSPANDSYETMAVQQSMIGKNLAADYVIAPNGLACTEQHHEPQFSQLSPPMKLARPGPIGRLVHTQCQGAPQLKETRRQIRKAQPMAFGTMTMEMGGEAMAPQTQRQMSLMNNSGNICEQSPSECQLVVLRQPEEQHRARYASEGSRGAIKDRSGTSFCTIQLLGHFRPTRVELFAAQRTDGNTFVEHNLYRLVPVSGKSATHGTERLEVMLRPENGMVVVLDCVGIMKICAYGAAANSKNNSSSKSKGSANSNSVPNCSRNATTATYGRHRRRTKGRTTNEEKAKGGGDEETMPTGEEQQKRTEQRRCQNDVHIVAQAQLPEGRVLRTQTEAIRCVQQLGCPDVLKMSLLEASSSGGQQLFIIGRNFNPKNLRVLFREYNNDGLLGWSAEAKLDQRLVHQCHIVCTVPTYHQLNRSALVSVTVICGPKQSHPVNFTYTACGRESDDDDWRPPDCAITGTTVLNGYGHNFVASGTYGVGTFNQHIAYGNQNLRQKFATGGRTATEMANYGNF